MKTKSLFSVLIVLLFVGSINAYAQSPSSDKKILIVYYSLRNGNTRIVAEQIQKNAGGDIFRIETVNSYPSVYRVNNAMPDVQTWLKELKMMK